MARILTGGPIKVFPQLKRSIERPEKPAGGTLVRAEDYDGNEQDTSKWGRRDVGVFPTEREGERECHGHDKFRRLEERRATTFT